MRPCEACDLTDVIVLRDNKRHEYRANSAPAVWQYQLLQCRNCGMGFVDPVPGLALLNTFYPKEYGNYQGGHGDGGPVTPLKEYVGRLRMRTVRRHDMPALLSVLFARGIETATGRTVSATLGAPLQFPHDAAIFDLGYGSGQWLRSMRKLGYTNLYAYDIDANSDHVKQLEAAGIHVSSGSFLDNDYPADAFDCIRLDHVFEHLPDPLVVLKKCRRMLKPGGIIAMAHPCFKSWIAEHGLDYSPSLMLPKHLYHHTPKSTALMLAKAGFVPRDVRSYGVVLQFASMLNNRRRANGRRMLSNAPFKFGAPLYSMSAYVAGRGDFISAWAQVPE